MKKNNELNKFKTKMVENTKKFANLDKEEILKFIKNNSKILISIIIILFLFIGYYMGSVKNNKEVVIKKLQQGLEKDNTRILSSIIEVNGEKVERKSLEPLTLYFKERQDKVGKFVELVREDKANKFMELKKRRSFFRDKYYVDLKVFDLKVTSNLKNTEVTLNKKKIKVDEIVSDLIPGQYSIVGEVKTPYGPIKETGEVSILENMTVDLKLKGEEIKINSPFKDAKVLVNGKDTGKVVGNFEKEGPLPLDGSISLSIEKNFPWGKIVSDSVLLESKPEVNLNLDMTNESLWEEIDKTINSFYTSVFKALNNENKEEILETTIQVKDKIYNILEKKYLFLKNEYKVQGIKVDREKSEFKEQKGVYKGTVVCDVEYTVGKNIFGILDFSTTKENKKFFTKVIYKDGKWIVEDIENFSL